MSLAIAALATLAGPAPSRAAAPVATLALGRSAFWEGGVRPAHRYLEGPDGDSGAVRDYPLALTQPGALLRVALDHPSYWDHFRLEIFDPRGRRVAEASGWDSMEAYVPRPRAGTWLARVYASSTDTDFRMRARLEAPPPPHPRPAQRMLPNLRLIPPFDFTFRSPYDRALLTGLPGRPHANCTADDVAEHAAVRCLRFSLGPANAGEGPFQLRFAPDGANTLTGRVFQRIFDSNGRFFERPAGTYEYHKTHMHYHHTAFGSLELLRVTDSKRGTMVKAGSGPKQGFCTADVIIFDWEHFVQGRQNSTESSCLNDRTFLGMYETSGTLMGMTPGWADLYDWSQDGNYVDFGLNPDGRYVVRSTTDALGYVLESNEKDNTSYAYIEVRGDSVRVLERGFGTSPWDPKKQLARDRLRANPRGYE